MSTLNGRLKCRAGTLHVDVPELVAPGGLDVRKVRASEAKEFQAACKIDDRENIEQVMGAMTALAILCLCDKKGVRLLEDGDHTELDAMPLDVVKRLGMAALDVNGMLAPDSAGNDSRRSDDSPSGSPENSELQTLTSSSTP